VQRLPHGYTNRTARVGDEVHKAYRGPETEARREREGRALAGLAGLVPVPPLLGDTGTELRIGWVPGRHGQELIEAGHAAEVLRACGAVLRHIQRVDPRAVLGQEAPRVGARGVGVPEVLVHGDFGPNNVLLAADFSVAAIVDWEWVHLGGPVADLAWCEWILRMHHPDSVGALPALFEGYGHEPAWSARQGAMVGRCRELLEFTRRWDPHGPGVSLWEERLAVTARWSERPR